MVPLWSPIHLLYRTLVPGLDIFTLAQLLTLPAHGLDVRLKFCLGPIMTELFIEFIDTILFMVIKYLIVGLG